MSEQHSYLEQIQKLSPNTGDLLVMNLDKPATPDQRDQMRTVLSSLAESLNCKLILLEPGMNLSLHVDPAAQLAEQQKQTALLERMVDQQAALLQAMADDGVDDEIDQPTTYMDGSPIDGQG